MTMANVLIRCLLSLVLGLSGVLSAHAGTMLGNMSPPAPVVSMEEAPCHEHAATEMAEKSAPEKLPSHNCCKAGQCTCACAAPAAAPLAQVALISLKASPHGLPSLLNYRSFILPLPLRPPIA